MQTSDKKRILILGGGFGGVTTAQRLQKYYKNSRDVEITLVNRENFFVFVPMLASAAAGSIDTLHIVNPIRRMAPKINFREEEVLGIDLRHRQVVTTSNITGRESLLPFDQLVVALGNVINLSSLPGLAQHGKTMKTLGDALHLRNHVISMLEAADIETDPQLRQEMLTFVVAGAGYSGVETIGELNDLVHDISKSYRSITKESLKLILLHSGERILPEMPESLAEFALKKLRQRGVDVRLKTRIAAATPREAILKSGERIATRTLVSTVGSAPNPALSSLGVEREKGRIITDQFMSVPGMAGLWALGDCAAVPNAASKGEYSPPTAQYALRQGKKLADNISAMLAGQPDRRKAFSFPGLGQLCLVGHRSGVAEMMGGIKLSGFIAWVMWRNIYLSKLPSWDRKLRVGLNWGLDLILPRDMTQLNLSRSQAINQVHYEPGDYIFRQGDVGNFFYVVSSGQVEISREKGNQVVGLATLGPGEHFGEAALMQGKRRNASARAVGPVDLIVLGHDDFNSLAGTWLKFTESIQALTQERESDPAFASRLFEASQDFRTAFASSYFNNVALPITPVQKPTPGPVVDRPVIHPPVTPNPDPVAPPVSPYGPVPGPFRPNTGPGGPGANQPGSGAYAIPVPVAPVPPPFRPRFIRSDGAELPLNLEEMRIGRSPENHIVLNDKQASRSHALLNRRNGAYVLTDQQTSNGTFVNGQAVKSHTLMDGDRVRIGSSEFVFRSS